MLINRVTGFGWADFRDNALVVDVGGGIGSQTMTLAQHYPRLRFIVQDRHEVLKEAVAVCYFPWSMKPLADHEPKYWSARLPGAIEEGRVTLQSRCSDSCLF